jgi:gliding motility-associated-like protein
MSTLLKYLLMTLCLSFLMSKIFAQGPTLFDCPQYPSYAFFDRSCLIKTAAPYGEIRLPQGGVDGLNEERPMHLSIPTNRPTWALGIAHAWNYNRNIIQRVDHPKISYWMAITGHETGMACDCGAQWPANRTPWNSLSPAFNAKCSEGLTQHDGCFQMEEANAWCGDLNQTWPWRFQPGEHQDYISKGHFSTSCLGLAYRNILNHYLIDYAWGIDIWPIITATADPNAYEKLMASGWNSWAAGVQDNVSGTAGGGQGFNLYTPAGRAAAIASSNWDLTATASRYPEVIGWTMNVLEQNTTSTYYQYNNPIVTSTPGASQNHVSYGYYNGNITLADVNQYLTEIYLFYSELTPARMAATTASVTAVFNSLNGGGAVPFMQIGPVIDEIILGLPKEIPLMSVIHNDGLPAYNNGYRQCIGDYAPASHINNNSESDTICKGQSVILEAMIDGGDGPNMTYTWYKDGIAVSGGNQKQMVLTPSSLGTFVYTVNVCNTDLGGCAPACCPKTIVVNDCNACGITATATTVNTPCQNMHGGTINLNITGSSNYTITYASDEFSGSKTGASSSTSITNLPDGVYNITIQDNVTATCKFKLSAEVKFTTPMNEKLTASIQSMTTCDAVLKTKLEQDDCECEWSVYFDTPYAAWERDVFVIITPSNGAAMRLRKDVLVNAYPAPTKATFKMCSGEKIKFEVEVQPSSGSCTGVAGYNQQNAPIEVYIKDPNGVKVLNQLIPIGTAQQYQNYTAFEYTVTCPYTPGNYTYVWNPGAVAGTPANVSGLNPTTYTVVATNTANTQCALTDTVYVPFDCDGCIVPHAVMSGTKSFCVGDSAQLSVALTGTQPFKIKLSNGSTKWTVSNINANTYSFYAKNAGTYKVDSVWDATCDTTGEGNTVVTVNALPTVSLGADKILCPNGSDSLKATTTFTSYLWSTNETSAGILVNTIGQYTLQATDAKGCKNKDTINVTLNPTIVITSVDSVFICPGSNITLNPTVTGGAGAFTYQWTGAGSGTADSLIASAEGWYTITVTDGKLCSNKDSIYVKENSSLVIALSDSTICTGDSITLTTAYSGVGYTYAWNTGATSSSIKIKTAGIYGVVIDNGTGCVGSDSMILSLNALPNVNIGLDKNICAGTSATLNAGLFSSYLWSTGATTSSLNADSSGTYFVKVTDNKGCVNRDTMVLSVIDLPTPDTIKDIQTCAGKNLVFDASVYDNGNGPYTYKWNDNSTASSLTLTNVNVNSVVFVDITDNYGCKGRDSAAITISPNLPVQISGNPDSVMCAGESIVLSTQYSSGYNFLWSTGENTQTITVDSAQTITLTVDDGNGCDGTDAIQIKVNPLPDMTLMPTTASVCSGAAATIGYDYGGGYSYLWSTTETTSKINTSVGASYSIEVTNTVTGCSADTAVLVSVHAKPIMTLGNDIDTCVGSTILLQPQSPAPNLTYLWGDNSTSNSLSVQTTASYFLTVTDTFLCSAKDTIHVNFKAFPVLDLLNGKDSASICEGETLALNAANAGMTYLWNVLAATPTIVVDNGGTYSVKVSNGNCSVSDTVYVKEVILPKNILSKFVNGSAASHCFIEDGAIVISIDTTANSYSYLWNTGETTSSIAVNNGGNYKVVLSEGKCAVSDEVKVIEYCPTTFYVPNAFTPNGDGKNNLFMAVGSNVKDFELLVFNRWGEQIFRSTDINTGWDGSYNSQLVQQDVYVYKILYSVNNENGNVTRKEKIGSITVIY